METGGSILMAEPVDYGDLSHLDRDPISDPDLSWVNFPTDDDPVPPADRLAREQAEVEVGGPK